MFVGTSRGRLLYGGLLGVIVIGGVLDQTTSDFVPPYALGKAAYRQDAEFVGRIEAALPPGSLVFQLPSVAFPEAPAVEAMDSAERTMWLRTIHHSATYLHSLLTKVMTLSVMKAGRWVAGTESNR